ncbi:MAG: kelch repeat-containing protein, partial [Limisphaerales bacterium]
MRSVFKSGRLVFCLAGVSLGLFQLPATPLTWFPGPGMDYPGSAAATVVLPNRGNVVIAGDTAYPEGLIATNIYWTPLGQPFSGNLAPGAVAGGGAIIIYGGNDGISSVSTVINYSPSDGSSSLASMSVPRSYLGYAPDRSGNAYAIGGLDDNNNPLSSAERYSQDAGTWSAIAGLPAARYDFPAVFDGTNQIYIFGGYTDTTSGVEIASALRYSVSKNTWTSLAPLPVAVAGCAAAMGPDGKIYVVGGLSGGVATNLVQVYTPANNSWVMSTPLPEALSAACLGVDSLGRLMVMGGMDANGNDVADVWRSQQLIVPDSPPVFTQLPGTNGTFLGAYTSTIAATGNPQPVYVLVSGPAGMTVDYFSGAITWTPQGLSQIGAIPVTIEATNYAGVTNYSFVITVPNPRPAPVSNLTVVGATENSVTLSWSPEDPVVGAVTYSAWIAHVVHSPKGSGATVTYSQVGSSTTATTITIAGLAAGLTRTYYLVATGAGGASGYNSAISATTLSAPTPNNLRVTGLTSTTISLAWDPPIGPVPVISYDILGVYNGVFVQYPLSFANITNTSFTITGLSPGTALQLGVAAYDVYGNTSAYSYLPSLVVNPLPVAPQLNVPVSVNAGDAG